MSRETNHLSREMSRELSRENNKKTNEIQAVSRSLAHLQGYAYSFAKSGEKRRNIGKRDMQYSNRRGTCWEIRETCETACELLGESSFIRETFRETGSKLHETDRQKAATRQVYHQASTDHRAISPRNKSSLPKRSVSKFLSSSRSIRETRSSDVLEGFNVKRFVEVSAICAETVACMGPIFQFRQVAIPFASRKFEARKIFRSRFASRIFFFANFCRSVGRWGRKWAPPLVVPKRSHTRRFLKGKIFMITQTQELFFKPRWQRTRFACLIRENEARIREFANENKLPIVVVEDLVRPVLGSGLWWPLPWICGSDHDLDHWECVSYCGPGHLVPPLDRCIQTALKELSIDYPPDFEHGWQDLRTSGFKSRDGAMIIACHQLGIPIRYYDASLIECEIYIPMPPRRKRRNNVPYYLR